MVAAALEAGFEAIYVPSEHMKRVKEMSVVRVVGDQEPADIVLGRDVAEVLITSHEDEEKVIAYQGSIPVIIRNKDWTIIPLENLISRTRNLIQCVHSAQEAALALHTMERGADGILLETNDIAEIKKTGALFHATHDEKPVLHPAEIVEVTPAGMGDRVIIDTTSLLHEGQGMLVGNSSASMLLVHNENVQNPYVAARPFRVNAGGVHAYIRLPHDTTKYLCELQSGDKALVVGHTGNEYATIVPVK